MNKPYLMSRESFGYVLNNEGNAKIGGEKFIPITAEQARDLDTLGPAAGVEILRAFVEANNAEALARAQAALDATNATATAPSPHQARSAGPEAPAAPEAAETDSRPWDAAAAIKGNPKKTDLAAFIKEKGESADGLSYEEMKALAANLGWAAAHAEG